MGEGSGARNGPVSPNILGPLGEAWMRIQNFRGLSGPKDKTQRNAKTAEDLDAALSAARDMGHKVEIGVEDDQVTVFVDGKSIGFTVIDDEQTRSIFAHYLI